ncbi:MAG: MFS transporter [Nostoc sp. DedQUE12a]|nr:MFS transporter [Nostoc sp. DedQUE12a]
MNRNFWITALIAFINSLSFTVLIPIIYLYGKQFGLSDFQTSLFFSISSIAQFFATPVIGKLSNCLGRKPLLDFLQKSGKGGKVWYFPFPFNMSPFSHLFQKTLLQEVY